MKKLSILFLALGCFSTAFPGKMVEKEQQDLFCVKKNNIRKYKEGKSSLRDEKLLRSDFLKNRDCLYKANGVLQKFLEQKLSKCSNHFLVTAFGRSSDIDLDDVNLKHVDFFDYLINKSIQRNKKSIIENKDYIQSQIKSKMPFETLRAQILEVVMNDIHKQCDVYLDLFLKKRPIASTYKTINLYENRNGSNCFISALSSDYDADKLIENQGKGKLNTAFSSVTNPGRMYPDSSIYVYKILTTMNDLNQKIEQYKAQKKSFPADHIVEEMKKCSIRTPDAKASE